MMTENTSDTLQAYISDLLSESLDLEAPVLEASVKQVSDMAGLSSTETDVSAKITGKLAEENSVEPFSEELSSEELPSEELLSEELPSKELPANEQARAPIEAKKSEPRIAEKSAGEMELKNLGQNSIGASNATSLQQPEQRQHIKEEQAQLAHQEQTETGIHKVALSAVASNASNVPFTRSVRSPEFNGDPQSEAKDDIVKESTLTAKLEKSSESDLQQQVATLEEHKRLKLQAMLSQKALPQLKSDTKTKTETKTEIKTKETLSEPKLKIVPSAPSQEKKLEISTKPKLDVKSEQNVTQDIEAKNEVQKTLDDVALKAPEENIVVDVAEIDQPGVYKILDWVENGRPVWAQDDFDALFFQVSGLTLAVPLVALGQIVNLDKKPTPIAGQSEWFMGMFRTSLGDVRTVNTALFVMPERYNPEFVDTAKFLISIDGLPWGLAVDAVNQPVRLKPHDVNWRKQRGKRPWLAGTVKSKMCALLDIPQIANMLDQSDKNRRR